MRGNTWSKDPYDDLKQRSKKANVTYLITKTLNLNKTLFNPIPAHIRRIRLIGRESAPEIFYSRPWFVSAESRKEMDAEVIPTPYSIHPGG
jgi:hypothetical protein